MAKVFPQMCGVITCLPCFLTLSAACPWTPQQREKSIFTSLVRYASQKVDSSLGALSHFRFTKSVKNAKTKNELKQPFLRCHTNYRVLLPLICEWLHLCGSPATTLLNKVSVLAFPKEAVNRRLNILFSEGCFLDNSVVVIWGERQTFEKGQNISPCGEVTNKLRWRTRAQPVVRVAPGGQKILQRSQAS